MADTTVTITEGEMYYVQNIVHRGLAALQETIDNCTRLAAEARDPENPCPEWAADVMDNQRAYAEQMLAESKQYIPDEFIV